MKKIKVCVVALGLSLVGCPESATMTADTQPRDSSVSDTATNVDAAGDAGVTTDATADATIALPVNFFPPRAAAFGMNDNAAGTLQVSASGEALAQQGFTYTRTPGAEDLNFVDGWSVQFDHAFVVMGGVRITGLAADPSMRTNVGAMVAQTRGPWLVDLVRAGPIVGAGGTPETAWPIAVIPAAGLSSSMRYAVSWDVVAASTQMQNINVPAADRSIVERMVARGWTKYFSGTATYAGRAPSATVDTWAQGYPTTVRFAFGFFDGTGYVNCHNPELGEDGENPANWGIQPSASATRRIQLTVHLDHVFWDQVDQEGTPLRFDALAARATAGVVDTAALAGSIPSALTNLTGQSVRDRGMQTTGYVAAAGAPPAYVVNTSTPNLATFIAYQARSQGHMNSDGECEVVPSGALSF